MNNYYFKKNIKNCVKNIKILVHHLYEQSQFENLQSIPSLNYLKFIKNYLVIEN